MRPHPHLTVTDARELIPAQAEPSLHFNRDNWTGEQADVPWQRHDDGTATFQVYGDTYLIRPVLEGPADLVVGLPLSMDGEEHELTRRARRFANQLQGRFGLAVTLVDERLTSFDADLRLREAGVKGRARKGLDDTLAAQQILQDLLDRVSHEPAHA